MRCDVGEFGILTDWMDPHNLDTGPFRRGKGSPLRPGGVGEHDVRAAEVLPILCWKELQPLPFLSRLPDQSWECTAYLDVCPSSPCMSPPPTLAAAHTGQQRSQA